MKERWNRIMRGWAPALVVAAALAGLAAGYLLRGGGTPGGGESGKAAAEAGVPEPAKPTIWTCPMHPQIRLPEPGQCPICFMDLVPLEESAGGDESPRRLEMSPAAVKLAEIETSPVVRAFPEKQIRMVGKVDYDETRLAYIAARVPGRLDRLFVDYTGVPVRKGDHLVYLYSPELFATQEALIQALRSVEKLEGSGSEIVRQTARENVNSARERLLQWGLTQEQIDEIEKRGEPSYRLTIYSPISGVVIHKNALEGDYVTTGSRIYTIADLSQVWVKLDAYESDLVWLHYGEHVEFEVEAFPGDRFDGRVAYIDPVLDAKTRSVKVRVNVDNRRGFLKPEMFVRAVVKPKVALGGMVMDPALASKWICPMHPEVIEDGPGECPRCGMSLVTTASLGFSEATADRMAPLVIPTSAPLITGKRAVVYVRVPGAERPTFEGREVVLGPRAGDVYLVQEGLSEGDEVVRNGAFKIDSSLQILARPSMMSLTATDTSGGSESAHGVGDVAPHAAVSSPDLERNLGLVFEAYRPLQEALASDNLEAGHRAAAELRRCIETMEAPADALDAWRWLTEGIAQAAARIAEAGDLQGEREGFLAASEALASALARFGFRGAGPIYVVHCPMAFDGRGADWLQFDTTVSNPYFGAAMLRCGEVQKTYTPRSLESGR